MCDLCVTASHTIGEVVPGLYLVRATQEGEHIRAGAFGLVRTNGMDVVWDLEPVPDPFPEMDGDEEGLDVQAHLKWCTLVSHFTAACRSQLDLTTAYDIATLCVEAGYSREDDGFLEYWLFHKMGVLMKDPRRNRLTEA